MNEIELIRDSVTTINVFHDSLVTKEYIEKSLEYLSLNTTIRILIAPNEHQPIGFEKLIHSYHTTLEVHLQVGIIEYLPMKEVEECLAKLLHTIYPLHRILEETKSRMLDSIGVEYYGCFSVIWIADSGTIHFPFVFDATETQYRRSIRRMLDEIFTSPEGQPLQNIAKNTGFNGYNLFEYKDRRWYSVDLHLKAGKDIAKSYLKNNDKRVHKPWVPMNRDNFRDKLVFDNNNYFLETESGTTWLVEPNDVSMFSSIAVRQRKAAHEYFFKEIFPSYEYLTSSRYPGFDKQKLYFDYFEIVIGAVIASYTAIEAFANLMIPEDYLYSINGKNKNEGITTSYKKDAIERHISLEEKLQVVLPNIYSTPKPQSDSTWWTSFQSLENIRNELIHAKRSRSNERYSRLLSKTIFDLIDTHIVVVTWFGKYIEASKPKMLDRFPFGFGHDGFKPGLVDPEFNKKVMRQMRNIPERE